MADPEDIAGRDLEPTLEQVFDTLASEMETQLANVTPEQLEHGGPLYQKYIDALRTGTADYRRAAKLAKAGAARAEAGLMPLRPCDLCDACHMPITGPHCCTCGLASSER